MQIAITKIEMVFKSSYLVTITHFSVRGLKKALKIAVIWPSFDVPSIQTYGLATGFKYLLVGVLLSFNFVRCILNQIIQISTPQNYLSQSCDDSLLEQLPIWIKILKEFHECFDRNRLSFSARFANRLIFESCSQPF